VLSAVGASRTVEPAVALASEALAPEIVAADPTVGTDCHCIVEAVPLFAVMHSDSRSMMMIGPLAMVNTCRR
jgi:hypothetical protein